MMTSVITQYGMLILSGALTVAAVVLSIPSEPNEGSGNSQTEEDNSQGSLVGPHNKRASLREGGSHQEEHPDHQQ